MTAEPRPFRKWLFKRAKRSANESCPCGSQHVRFKGLVAICAGCEKPVMAVSAVKKVRMLHAARSLDPGPARRDGQIFKEADARREHFRSI